LYFTVDLQTNVDWSGLVIFALLVMMAEGLAIDIYVKETAVSTSAAPYVAGIMLFGPNAVLVLSLTLAVTALIKHRSPISRFVFNAGNQVIAGLLCSGLIVLTGSAFAVWPTLIQMILSLLSAGVVYISTTTLVALGIDISTGVSFWRVWEERFQGSGA